MRAPITHVALRFEGEVFALPRPNRHHDLVRAIVRQLGVSHVDVPLEDEGFLDETGRFLNRKQALVSALVNNQVAKPEEVRLDMLMSEDVW